MFLLSRTSMLHLYQNNKIVGTIIIYYMNVYNVYNGPWWVYKCLFLSYLLLTYLICSYLLLSDLISYLILSYLILYISQMGRQITTTYNDGIFFLHFYILRRYWPWLINIYIALRRSLTFNNFSFYRFQHPLRPNRHMKSWRCIHAHARYM